MHRGAVWNSTQIYWKEHCMEDVGMGFTSGTSSPDQLVETPALARN
jgi:hypothetical protein